ncbi:hypothetical protein GMDG_04486 [Pseudogymnoascus destructans 20631-21]|uniref:PD-(D/E)XK nuclease-like domain-containing protein n=1 Tax=Pseudogymnoascus destructans (strain ATCC MYA-4855 / 20631-21) TaxID=658429 RepID=L8GDC8_PSED2|nr:hypothetical protein GMDG_04486 [Pseudogymnoascus destructans 20631-21]
MCGQEQYNPGAQETILSWLGGLQSPPSSRESSAPQKRTRGDSPSMSRSPKKRKTNPPTAPSDALSEYSLPTPSDRVRASSPPRELREIYKYAQPPIRFLTTPDEHTPETVLELFKNLQEASSAAAIPAIFKARIHDTYPYQSIPLSAFVPTEQTLQSSEVESTWKLAASLLSKARQAFEGNEPEGSWIRLASEVLDGVFEGSELKLLRTMDVQYSDINSATLLPTVNDFAIPVKKADLAVAIHSAKPAASMIYESIRKQNPAMKLSQMQDASVSRMALPICVEVGEPGKSYNEASIQLGVWCCAGLLKLHELRLQQGDIDAEETVPLIGMTAIGLDWKSHVAYKLPDDGAVVILGPVSIGGYEDIRSFFVLNSVFKIIAKWAEQDYWTHFRGIFGV